MPTRKPTLEDMEPGSGLFDGGRAAIVRAWFGVKKEYQDKGGGEAPMLFLRLKGPEMEKEIEQGYYTGDTPGWEVTREMREVVSSRNPENVKFNAKSRAGALADSMLAAVGKGDRKKGQEFFVERGYFMTQAEFYEGLDFDWFTKQMPRVDGTMSAVIVPVTFYGTVKLEGVAAPTGNGSAAAPDETEKKLVEFASGKTPKELKIALTSAPGFKDNKALMNAVFNKGYLEELEKAGKLGKAPDGKYI